MCFGDDSPPAVDTSAQEAELRRQTDILTSQSQMFALQQQRQAIVQQSQSDYRYAQQRSDDLAEADRQRLILEGQLAQQRGLADEANAKAEELRQYDENQAQVKAERDRNYTEGRSSLIDETSNALDSTYSGFDDNYYNAYRSSLIDSQLPDLQHKYAEDRTAARLALAQNSNLNSSAGAHALGEVQRGYQGAETTLATSADDAVTALTNQIADQKRSALTSLLSSVVVGDPTLPDGTTDVQNSLDQIASRLSSYVQSIQTQVGKYVPIAGGSAITAPTVSSTVTPQAPPQNKPSTVPAPTVPAVNYPTLTYTAPDTSSLDDQIAQLTQHITSLTGGVATPPASTPGGSVQSQAQNLLTHGTSSLI